MITSGHRYFNRSEIECTDTMKSGFRSQHGELHIDQQVQSRSDLKVCVVIARN